MNDVVVMSKVECEQQLNGDAPHYLIGNHVLRKPCAKAPESFANQLKYEADVFSIRTGEFKVISQMTDLVVPKLSFVLTSEVSENLSLKEIFLCAIRLSTEDFDSNILVRIDLPKNT